MTCDCEWLCSDCDPRDGTVPCEAFDCQERVDREGQEDKTLLAPLGLPYCSRGCKLYALGLDVLDNLPLELRAVAS